MPISGLVVTFQDSSGPSDEVLEQIRNADSIELGDVQGNKCAVVIDSASKQEDQQIVQWVQELPGVVAVDIAFVGFDD